MRAVQLEDIGKLNLVEKEVPVPGNDEVLVNVKYSGICGSDIPRTFETGSYYFPTVLGHEFAGEIVKVGKEISDEHIGKKVAIFPLLPCKECTFCSTGDYAQCKNYKYFGSRNDGGFQEYLAVPFWNLVFIDENVPLDQAAMIEPATVAQHVINKSEMRLGENLVIYGAGPIGLMVAQWAKIVGANEIIIFDVDQTKVKFAKEIGFKNVFNNSKRDVDEVLKSILGSQPAHVVVEASGNSNAFNQCVQSVGTFGRIILLGNPLSDMKVDKRNYDQFMRKEAQIIGVFNSVYKKYSLDEWKNTANALKNGDLNLAPLVTHKVGFDELIDAFHMINNNEEFYCKVMLEVD